MVLFQQTGSVERQVLPATVAAISQRWYHLSHCFSRLQAPLATFLPLFPGQEDAKHSMHDLMLLWMQSSNNSPLVFQTNLSHCRIVRPTVTLFFSHRNLSLHTDFIYENSLNAMKTSLNCHPNLAPDQNKLLTQSQTSAELQRQHPLQQSNELSHRLP